MRYIGPCVKFEMPTCDTMHSVLESLHDSQRIHVLIGTCIARVYRDLL